LIWAGGARSITTRWKEHVKVGKIEKSLVAIKGGPLSAQGGPLSAQMWCIFPRVMQICKIAICNFAILTGFNMLFLAVAMDFVFLA
jgi:ABC-type antimicrobial peptide transport system permease subunit